MKKRIFIAAAVFMSLSVAACSNNTVESSSVSSSYSAQSDSSSDSSTGSSAFSSESSEEEPAVPADIVYLVFNSTEISDWRVRAALTLSLDRSTYDTDSSSAAYGIVAENVDDSTGYNFEDGAPEPGNIYSTLKMLYPDYNYAEYSDCCNAAKSLYDEAVSDGSWNSETQLSFVINSDDELLFLAEDIAEEWQNVLGVNVNISYVESDEYDSALADGGYSITEYIYSNESNDPLEYFNLFTSDNSISYSFSNEMYDEFVSNASLMDADVTRDSELLSAEQILFSEDGFPAAPLYNINKE